MLYDLQELERYLECHFLERLFHKLDLLGLLIAVELLAI